MLSPPHETQWTAIYIIIVYVVFLQRMSTAAVWWKAGMHVHATASRVTHSLPCSSTHRIITAYFCGMLAVEEEAQRARCCKAMQSCLRREITTQCEHLSKGVRRMFSRTGQLQVQCRSPAVRRTLHCCTGRQGMRAKLMSYTPCHALPGIRDQQKRNLLQTARAFASDSISAAELEEARLGKLASLMIS